MNGELTPLVAASGAGLTVLLFGLALIRVTASRDERVRDRVAALTRTATATAIGPAPAEASLLRDRRVSNLPLLDALLRGRAWSVGTRDRLERAGLRLRVGEYLLLRLAVAAGCALLGLLLTSSLLNAGVFGALAGAPLGFMLPALWVRRRINARARMMEQQLVELTELMASMLSSGFGYMQALMSAAEQLDDPLATEVRRLVDTVQFGGEMDDALHELGLRLDSRDFDIVATALTVHRSAGGDLGEILRGVARTIRDRQSFARELSALTSRERYSAIVVAGFPIVIALVLTLMVPDIFGTLITEPTGRLILLAALILDGIGYFAIKRVSKIKV